MSNMFLCELAASIELLVPGASPELSVTVWWNTLILDPSYDG